MITLTSYQDHCGFIVEKWDSSKDGTEEGPITCPSWGTEQTSINKREFVAGQKKNLSHHMGGESKPISGTQLMGTGGKRGLVQLVRAEK